MKRIIKGFDTLAVLLEKHVNKSVGNTLPPTSFATEEAKTIFIASREGETQKGIDAVADKYSKQDNMHNPRVQTAILDYFHECQRTQNNWEQPNYKEKKMEKPKKVIIIATSEPCTNEKKSFYEILKLVSEEDCDQILLLDNNNYITANVGIKISISRMKSKDFKPDPKTGYTVVLNPNKKECIARIIFRISCNPNVLLYIGGFRNGKFVRIT